MRVTNNMLIRTMMLNLNSNLARMDKVQQQMATGKKIRVPSDDPIVAARALKFRTDVSEIEQFQKNTSDAMSWLEVTETALANMGDVLQRARELTVQASNGTLTDEDRQKIKAELGQLKQSIVEIGNTTYAGRYIFAGFKTDTAPFAVDGAGNLTYQGSAVNSAPTGQEIFYEISVGNRMQVNVEGYKLFWDGTDERIFKTFTDLEAAIDSGDQAQINSCIEKFDRDMNQLLTIRADVGGRMNYIELTENRLQDNYVNFTSLMSKNEDVDMAEVIMRLKSEENVYRASLFAGARIIQPTLVDFLR